MSASVMLGLMSAFCYGTTDFIARFAARRVGVLRTMVYAQWLAAALLTVAVVATRIPSGPLTSWTLLLGSNLVILAATALLYHALKVGRLAVVAPVVASYGGVTVILAAISGEALDGYKWPGLGVLLIGILSVARPASPINGTSEQRSGSGLLPAAVAALLYGTAFWIQGRWAIPIFGMLPCVWSYYMLGAALVPAIGIVGGVNIRPPSGRDLMLVAATSLFAVTAYLSLAAGQSLGSVAVVTMLSSQGDDAGDRMDRASRHHRRTGSCPVVNRDISIASRAATIAPAACRAPRAASGIGVETGQIVGKHDSWELQASITLGLWSEALREIQKADSQPGFATQAVITIAHRRAAFGTESACYARRPRKGLGHAERTALFDSIADPDRQRRADGHRHGHRRSGRGHPSSRRRSPYRTGALFAARGHAFPYSMLPRRFGIRSSCNSASSSSCRRAGTHRLSKVRPNRTKIAMPEAIRTSGN
jgi:uncharacterized membrane protein